MQARVLLWLSLGLNIALAVMIVLLSRESIESLSASNLLIQTNEGPKQIKTNVVIRRQAFSWAEIETNDFSAYITNLRRIGCPERTIRDIIVAEVDDLYAEKVAREVAPPEQKWWLPEPDMDSFQEGMDRVRAIELEKQQLLTQLLGPGWDRQRPLAPASSIRFDGPVLSKLPAEMKSAVERIETNSRRVRAELEERSRQEGREPDGAELARLRQETRRELAGILTAEQLEEYLLRYSQTAEAMRDQLRGFEAGPDEFRRIFRIRDEYEQQLAALTGNDAGILARRAELERLRDEAIRREITPERFEFYRLTSNPLFREAQEQAEQNAAPPEKVFPIFRINQAVEEEIGRIQADRNITEDQRRVAIAAVQQQQRNSIERVLGGLPPEPDQAAPPREQPRQQQIILPPLPEVGRVIQPGALATPR